MARDGEILNRDLLERVAAILQLGGVKRPPNQMNLDQVQLVMDITPLAYQTPPLVLEPAYSPAAFRPNDNHTGNLPANTGSVGVNLLGSNVIATVVVANGQGDFAVSSTREGRILSINASVGYTAAGAALDVGTPLIAQIQLRDPSGLLTFPVQETFAIVENVSPYSYNWTFPAGRDMANSAAASYVVGGSSSGWDGYVPPGWTCGVVIQRKAGFGFFPALTSIDTYFAVAQRIGMGDWKP